jgi:hypothetical protein
MADDQTLSSLLIGSVQLTTVLPFNGPARFNTSSTRVQWTASTKASAFATASSGVPARARGPASRASRWSFLSLCE